VLAASLSVIALAPAPAEASTPSILVTTLGRNGAKVATTASVVNVTTHDTYQVASGKRLYVPSGRYAVLVDIWNSADSTDTLGAQVVSVSGTTSVTIDARKGKAFKVSLDSSPGVDYTQGYSAQLCVGEFFSGSIGAWGGPGRFFMIPNAAKELRMAYLSYWHPAMTGDVYAVTGQTTGLPGSLGKVFARSSLATVSISARRGPASSPDTTLAVQPYGNNCQMGLYNGFYTGQTPVAVKTHLSPGKWTIHADTWGDVAGSTVHVGSWDPTRTLAAGGSYSQTFFGSAWGPAYSLPIVSGRRISFDTSDMITDYRMVGAGADATVKTTASLSFGGKVLSTQTRTEWGGASPEFSKAITSSGWYTLTATARRYRPGITYPTDMLSPKVTATYRFYANASSSVTAPGFVTHFAPAGLNSRNQAAPLSTTTVAMGLHRRAQRGLALPKQTIRSVKAWASFDGGKTWHASTVKGSGNVWSASVHNPAAGKVTLRATVTDTRGNTSTMTIYNAYAIR
jgi:hypothetical protein